MLWRPVAVMGHLWRSMLKQYFVFGLCPFLSRRFCFTPNEKGDARWKRMFGKLHSSLSILDAGWHRERAELWDSFDLSGALPSTEEATKMFHP